MQTIGGHSMHRDQRFWDRIARRYAAKPVSDAAAYRKKLDATQACLDPSFEVVEFGCGTGSTALEHAPHVASIRAFDVSAGMLEIARDKAAKAAITNVSFEQASFNDMPVAEESCDVAMGLNVVHLLDDPGSAANRVFRMLKPGGLYISSTPCLGDNLKWLRFISPLGRALGLMPTLSFFTQTQLIDGLVAAGFVLEHQWQQGDGRNVFVIVRKPKP